MWRASLASDQAQQARKMVFCRVLRLRRQTQHDVEPGGQFPHARVFDRGEIDRQQVASFGIAHRHKHSVALIARVSLDIALRCEGLLLGNLDGDVNVGRPARVGHRLDRAEIVLAARSGPCDPRDEESV